MKIRISFTIFILILLVGKIYAQEIEVGVIGGMNLNVVALRSDYEINEDINVSPNLSYNIGTTLKINKGRKFGLFSLEYYRLSNKYNPQLIFYDDAGSYYGAHNTSVVLHNLRLSTLFNIKIIGGFFCGGGVAGNFNIDSKLILNRDLENSFGTDFYGDKFEASFIRDFTISIPIMIGYEFNKFDIIFVFDKGIMNRLDGNDGFIKEINNVLTLNFNYRFLQI